MVFGLGGRGGGGGAPASNPQMEMATAELDMITDTFNKLVSSCHAKCITPRYAEGDLTKAEGNCIDRCVAKFFVVNQKVGEKMQAMGTAAQQNGAFAR